LNSVMYIFCCVRRLQANYPSKMTTVIPGTLYRCYADDGRHWTAVVCLGGSLLEVKTPYGVSGRAFENVEEWSTARGCSRVEADSSKVSGPLKVVKDTHGFNYDWSRRYFTRITNWIYELIEESSPQLLEREEVRDEFNKLVELFEKYSAGMRCWCGHKKDRYHDSWLIPVNLPFAYPVMPGVTSASEGYRIIQKAYSDGLYKHLGDVRAYMKRVEDIKWMKKAINHREIRVHHKKYRADYYMREYTRAKEEVDTMKMKLADLEAGKPGADRYRW
jgi:hypothetical protein